MGLGTLITALALGLGAPASSLDATNVIPDPRSPNPLAIQEGTAEAQQPEPVLVPESSDKAMRYYRSGMVLWGVNIVWSLAVPALILFTGLSAKIKNRAQRIGRAWWAAAAVYAIIYFCLTYLVDLPLDFYQSFIRQHAYGLSNQSFGQWFGDSLKALMLLLIFVALVVPGTYFFLRKSPRRWWLYTAIAGTGTIALIRVIFPIWIAPLFDDFGPMKDKSLEAEILALADRAGIESSRVFEVNKSADTETVNAYVSGSFGTKRIVLWDTIIEKLDREQLLFVMGHEMGHYALGHLWKSLLFVGFLLTISLYAAYRTVDHLIDRFRHRFGFDRVSDVASLPLILLLVSLFSFVLTPVGLGFGRYREHEADRFGLEITQDNHAAATTWLVLQRENLSNPRPGFIYRTWRASHPVLADRIEFSNTYRPWATGGELKYGSLFRD